MKNIIRKKNTYYSDFRTKDGKRVRKSLGKDLDEARIKLAELMAGKSIAKKSNPAPQEPQHDTPKIGFKKAVNEYIESKYDVAESWDKKLDSKMQAATALLIYKRLQKHSRSTYVSDFNYKHVNIFIDSIAKKISNHAANKYLNHVQRFFQFCENYDYIYKSPARRIDKRKLTPHKRYFFSDDEVARIIQNAGHFRLFFEFMFETGLRPTDMYNLQQKHFKDGCISKRQNKTDKFLNVPISDRANEIVNSLGDPLFPTAHDRRWRTLALANLQANFDYDFIKKNHIVLHTIRHTFAETKHKQGVPKEVIQQLLGHSSIITTEIYANSLPKEVLRKYL